MHPFVALMRVYCIDYTNSHDQTLYEQIMEPDYVVHTMGLDLIRSTSYSKAVTGVFAASPGLGLAVHEFILNGDRLCMHFSEHGAMGDSRALTCWRGIGLYQWNGTRLTENWVEQDYFAMRAQIDDGVPHPLKSPHLDPWVTTEPVPADPANEAVVRQWLAAGALGDVAAHEYDDERTGAAFERVLDVDEVVVNDLFSAGSEVPFFATQHGAYRGGLGPTADAHVGERTTLRVAGIAHVEDGLVTSVRGVTQRLLTLASLTKEMPALF